MSTISDYHNPTFYNSEFGDFTRFYIIIAIITTVGAILFVLNLVLGCCSQHSNYWGDRHTGNRWIVSLWTATPHNQTAIDYTELERYAVPRSIIIDSQKHPYEYSNIEFQHHQTEVVVQPEPVPAQFIEMKKRESDI